MTFTKIAATVVAASLSTAAFAQDTSVAPKVGVDAGVEAGAQAGGAETGVKTDAQAGAAMEGNYGSLISSLQNGSVDTTQWSTQLASIEEGADVQIVKLSELKGEAAGNASALDNAMAKHEADVAASRQAIEDNEVLRVALEEMDFDAEDVVAINVDSTSSVTLVVDDSTGG